MKLHAAIKVGLMGGLVVGLCMQLTAYIPFYETTYQFHLPGWLPMLFNIIGWPVIAITVLALGPMAVRAAGEAACGWREAALVGGGAGLVTGMITYMIAGMPALVIVLGVVPLIVPLSDPSSVAGVRVDEVRARSSSRRCRRSISPSSFPC